MGGGGWGGGQRTGSVGGGTIQRQPQSLLNSPMPPSGKIWVLQEMGMDGIAKGSELEDTSKEMSGPLWPVLQMPREGKDLLSGHSG